MRYPAYTYKPVEGLAFSVVGFCFKLSRLDWTEGIPKSI